MVRQLVTDGEFKKALSIVKGFRLGITREQTDKMRLAYECMIHPRLYEQIGKDTTRAITEGIQILKALYGENEN